MDLGSINELTATLDSLFHISPVTLIPMAVVLVMMITRFSALLSILVGSVVGVLVSVLYQGFDLAAVVGYMNTGFSIQCDNAIISSCSTAAALQVCTSWSPSSSALSVWAAF